MEATMITHLGSCNSPAAFKTQSLLCTQRDRSKTQIQWHSFHEDGIGCPSCGDGICLGTIIAGYIFVKS